MPDKPWTIEEITKLCALHATGISFKDMMKDFPGRTKDALLGKAHKLELPRRKVGYPKGRRRSWRPKRLIPYAGKPR